MRPPNSTPSHDRMAHYGKMRGLGDIDCYIKVSNEGAWPTLWCGCCTLKSRHRRLAHSGLAHNRGAHQAIHDLKQSFGTGDSRSASNWILARQKRVAVRITGQSRQCAIQDREMSRVVVSALVETKLSDCCGNWSEYAPAPRTRRIRNSQIAARMAKAAAAKLFDMSPDAT